MYEVTLTHAGTSLQSPDYDYTLACTPPDDVTLHAYVIGGGGLESDSKSLTVGQVKVEAVSEFPTNRARHVFGPLEETNLSIVPQQLFASTTMTGTIPYNGTLTRTPTNYSMRVCNRHRNFSITVNHANKETVPIPFSVIEPDRKLLVVSHGALAPDLWRLHANLSASYAGDIGVALRLEVFMKPSYVWFGHLYVEELFAPATNIWFFFADPSMFHKGDLDHGEQQGANRVMNVEGPNRVGFDHPAFAMRGHVGLRAGGFKHNIPTIRYTDDYCVTNEIGTFTQQFKLEADGRLKVSKYGKWAMRALDGTAMPIIDSWE